MRGQAIPVRCVVLVSVQVTWPRNWQVYAGPHVQLAVLIKMPEPDGQGLVPAGSPGIEEGQLQPRLREKLELCHRLNLG